MIGGNEMKIYLATWLLEPEQGNALTKKEKKERLISYYRALEYKKHIKKYIQTGRNKRI